MTFIFLSSGFSQESQYLFQPKKKVDPCFDNEYLRIKEQIETVGMDSVNQREWEYFKIKDTQCSEVARDKKSNRALNAIWGLLFIVFIDYLMYET